jgi:hypothetical protein
MDKRIFTIALCAMITSATVLTVKNRAGEKDAPTAITRAQPPKREETPTASPAPVIATQAEEEKPIGASVPDQVVYWHLFHHNNLLVRKAEAAERLGKDATFLRDFYKREAKLNDSEAVMFNEIATSCELEVAALDAEAKSIIDEFRARRPSGLLQPGEKLPPPPPQLQALQQRRNNAILQARDRLKQGLGQLAFAEFQKFVDEKVAPEITQKPFDLLRPAPPAGQQRQPQSNPYENDK